MSRTQGKTQLCLTSVTARSPVYPDTFFSHKVHAEVPGQELNPCHSSDDTGSLTWCTTRELPNCAIFVWVSIVIASSVCVCLLSYSVLDNADIPEPEEGVREAGSSPTSTVDGSCTLYLSFRDTPGSSL